MSNGTSNTSVRVKRPGRIEYGDVIADNRDAWTASGDLTKSAPRAGMVKVHWHTDDSDELWWEPLDELVELTILPADSYTHCHNTNCRRALLVGDLGQDCGDHWYCDACANKPR